LHADDDEVAGVRENTAEFGAGEAVGHALVDDRFAPGSLVDQFPAPGPGRVRVVLAAVVAHVDNHRTGASRLFQDPGDFGTDSRRVGDRLRRQQHVSLNVDHQQRSVAHEEGSFEPKNS
jgi:hypothetical protein